MNPFDQYADTFVELKSAIERNSISSGVSSVNIFVDEYSVVAADSGDAPDLFPVEIFKDGNYGYQINAYNFDLSQGELTLAVADTEFVSDLATITRQHAEKYIKRAFRFYSNCKKLSFIDELEESSDAYELASYINQNIDFIKRLRIIFFTTGVSTIQKALEFEQIDGVDFSRNVFDLVRYHNILANQSVSENYEIIFEDFGVDSLPLLPASQTDGYQSYMGVMPGDLLAKIYSLYGGKLLEQNVRVFLQARTKVNRGIIDTIQNSPDHFFAYNNGLTVTAKSITTENVNGVHHLKKVNNLQIVNGGQTTASILYARDKNKSDLTSVSVQMKLNVTNSDVSSDLVKNISRFSNTQNAVREADFFSTHPFHVFMEKTSQRIETPLKLETGIRSKWFYERARGQFKDRQAYMTPRKREQFLSEFPRSQLVDKTGLSKFYMSLDGKPYLVSQGAQKCFLAFADIISSQWKRDPAYFNDDVYKEFIAKAIFFIEVDKAVAASKWYKENRGYKAEIVTYAIACIAKEVEELKLSIDYSKIWTSQGFDAEQLAEIADIAKNVREIIVNPPASTSNIREYCKKIQCWEDIKRLNIASNRPIISTLTIQKTEAKERKVYAKKQGKIDLEIQFEIFLQNLVDSGEVGKLLNKAKQTMLLTPNAASAFRKLNRNSIILTYPEKDALKRILKELQIEISR